MSIILQLPSALSAYAEGLRVVETAGTNVGEALTTAFAQFPALAPRIRDDQGKLYPFVTLYLNDEDVRFLGGFEASVQDGDELTVVPAVAGG